MSARRRVAATVGSLSLVDEPTAASPKSLPSVVVPVASHEPEPKKKRRVRSKAKSVKPVEPKPVPAPAAPKPGELAVENLEKLAGNKEI